MISAYFKDSHDQICVFSLLKPQKVRMPVLHVYILHQGIRR